MLHQELLSLGLHKNVEDMSILLHIWLYLQSGLNMDDLSVSKMELLLCGGWEERMRCRHTGVEQDQGAKSVLAACWETA